MERYLKVYRLIEKVWVVHSKPQVKAQRTIHRIHFAGGRAVLPKFARII
jgi:hypothetical protein